MFGVRVFNLNHLGKSVFYSCIRTVRSHLMNVKCVWQVMIKRKGITQIKMHWFRKVLHYKWYWMQSREWLHFIGISCNKKHCKEKYVNKTIPKILIKTSGDVFTIHLLTKFYSSELSYHTLTNQLLYVDILSQTNH